ncbi:hypothetical protein KSS87_003957, partial [Heliosperma pusillum]
IDKVMTKEKEELSVSGVDDVFDILKSDYFGYSTAVSAYMSGHIMYISASKIRLRRTVTFISCGVISDRDYALATWSLRPQVGMFGFGLDLVESRFRPLLTLDLDCIQDLTLQEAETIALAILKQVTGYAGR